MGDEFKDNDEQILQGWMRISEEYRGGNLTEEEEAQFEKAKLADKQAQNTRFVLGEPILKNI
jgi:hypothetical protein